MTEDEILSALKPCPFCGAGETSIRPINYRGIIGVRLGHWCSRTAGCDYHYTEVRASNEASAISQWNARAGGAE